MAICEVKNYKSKTLGNLTPDQLSRFVEMLKGFEGLESDLPQLLKQKRIKRILDLTSVFFQWSWVYEMSFAEMLALALVNMGEIGFVHEAAASADPQEFVISHAEDYEPDFSKGKPKLSRVLLQLAYLVAVFKSLRSVQLHAISINALIQQGREGDDDAFVRAVSVDPTCMACPSLAKRMSIAVMNGEKKFLRRIGKAAIDGPNKALKKQAQLRYVGVVLQEAGAFKRGNREHIYNVVVNEIGLYDHGKSDSFKAIFRNFDLWLRASTT